MRIRIVVLLLLVGSTLAACTGQPEATAPAETATPVPVPLQVVPDDSLRGAAQQCGLVVGAAVRADALAEDAQYRGVLSQEFAAVTTENALKFRDLSSAPNQYDFQDADAIVDFAIQNGMQVRGHTLVWHKALPAWLNAADFAPNTLAELLRRHVYTVVGRYRGQVAVWDVVNEAVDSEGKMRDMIWRDVFGYDYIAQAFRWAHEADPNALLFYNDYDIENAGPKADAVYELAQSLVHAGVPIQGVGFEMHLKLNELPDYDALRSNMERLTALGLQVQITELDVQVQDADGPLAARLDQQAEVYRNVLQTCLAVDGCTGVNTWGFTDAYSWIPGFTGQDDWPLVFDADYTPKPAYTALRDVLDSCQKQSQK